MKPLFRSSEQKQAHSRSGIAFIIEMLVLLVLVAGCLSVLIEAFAFAHQQGEENNTTVEAVHLAANTAERFSADPSSVPEVEVVDDLAIHTSIERELQVTGVLYKATIEVYDADDRDAGAGSKPYYGLETARYVKFGGAGWQDRDQYVSGR